MKVSGVRKGIPAAWMMLAEMPSLPAEELFLKLFTIELTSKLSVGQMKIELELGEPRYEEKEPSQEGIPLANVSPTLEK